ncbi:epoxide hydrolase [Ensifer sp. Root31]|uniref:alpha/beta fold hydrolase n=1 Tax=Ensifer sp. Root31 TaxID=1736512 RepID=UPI00070BB3A5|nr:alpha/beta hydrolase [Ensifer sp. Root31]KQU82050.1 epoxide hydrolase [Ensifer sp. Root31]
MQERLVDANGIRLNFLEAGEGPAVLLCHGFPETAYAWRHQVAALAAAGFHAIAPDMRGYGKSSRPDEVDQYTLFHLAGDMVGLLDTLGVENAIIVGNDWGASVAWQAVLLRPDRFTGVVAIGVPMMSQPPAPPTQIFPKTADALFYALYFQEPGVAEAEFERDVALTLRKLMFAASGEAGPRDDDRTPNPFGMVSKRDGLLASLPVPAKLPDWIGDAEFENFVHAFRQSGFSGGLNYYRNLDRNWALQSCLKGKLVDVPAVYLMGERDTGLAIPGMRAIIAEMPRLVPKLVDTIFLPDCGHWVPQERPDDVSTAIIRFAQGL